MLVIFDCDGVLVDSEPIANRVFAQLIQEHGWPITLEETMERFVGRSLPSCMALIEQHLGRPLPENFADHYHARIAEAFSRELKPMPGAREAVRSLECAYCVASSSGHEKLRMTLDTVGLLDLFEPSRIFSSEDVANGKPAPDLFLYAASQMGFAPSDCIVVEDSLAGVQAGVAAGMRVIALKGHADRQTVERLGAAWIESLSEVAGAMGQTA